MRWHRTARYGRSVMIHTEGLTHIHFAVGDLDGSLRFYQEAFGMRELFRVEPDMVFLQTPAGHDCITLHADAGHELEPGKSGGIAHFGFTLTGESTVSGPIAQVDAPGPPLCNRAGPTPRTPS